MHRLASPSLTPPPQSSPLSRVRLLGMGAITIALAGCGPMPDAPTCGPCCHSPDSAECLAQDGGVDDDAGASDAGISMMDAGPIIAPTCGPCCHSPELPECQPQDAGPSAADAG